MDYVRDFWWEAGYLGTGPTPNALRRNFDAISPVKPWLVTDIAIAGKESQATALRESLGRPKPASISIPSHYNGLLLDDIAHLEITNVDRSMDKLVPPSLRTGPLRSSHFWMVVHEIRLKERQTNGNDADLPGLPVP